MVASRVLMPLTKTLPVILPSKKCGMRPFNSLQRVVLPEPFGPAISTTSPGRTVKLIPLRDGFLAPSYVHVRFSIRTAGGSSMLGSTAITSRMLYEDLRVVCRF
jgi:hypothetical protein